MSISRKYGKTYNIWGLGGPYNGKRMLVRGETMVFRVGKFHGKYDKVGRWINV